MGYRFEASDGAFRIKITSSRAYVFRVSRTKTDITRRFEADAAANAQLATTVRLDSVREEDYDSVF